MDKTIDSEDTAQLLIFIGGVMETLRLLKNLLAYAVWQVTQLERNLQWSEEVCGLSGNLILQTLWSFVLLVFWLCTEEILLLLVFLKNLWGDK